MTVWRPLLCGEGTLHQERVSLRVLFSSLSTHIPTSRRPSQRVVGTPCFCVFRSKVVPWVFLHGVYLYLGTRTPVEETPAVLVSWHHPSTGSFPIHFSRLLTWCRMMWSVLAASQVNHSVAICPYNCADSGRNSLCSRRRVYHPVYLDRRGLTSLLIPGQRPWTYGCVVTVPEAQMMMTILYHGIHLRLYLYTQKCITSAKHEIIIVWHKRFFITCIRR